MWIVNVNASLNKIHTFKCALFDAIFCFCNIAKNHKDNIKKLLFQFIEEKSKNLACMLQINVFIR